MKYLVRYTIWFGDCEVEQSEIFTAETPEEAVELSESDYEEEQCYSLKDIHSV